MRTTTILLALAVVLAIVAAQAQAVSAKTTCSRFKTCWECVCARSGYTTDNTCQTTSGCSWCPSTNSCTSLAALNNGTASADEGICPGRISPNADELLHNVDDDDEMSPAEMCELPMKRGVILVLCICLGFAAIAATLTAYCCTCRNSQGKNKRLDLNWLVNIALAHTPPGQSPEWQGASVKPKPTDDKGMGVALFFVTLALTVPSLVWLMIGLPVAITPGFGFFYPCLFVGGLGLLGLFAVLLGASDANTPGPNGMVYAYVITPEHCVVATGHYSKREQKSVTVYNVADISQVTVQGNNVHFTTAGRQLVQLLGLEDTSKAFLYLQRRTGRATTAGAGVGAGTAADMPTATAVTVGVVAGSSSALPPAGVTLLDAAGNPRKVAPIL